jgi:hypothetical protein
LWLIVPVKALIKFSDFFIPKIARSDPEVREQAIMECNDKELVTSASKYDTRIEPHHRLIFNGCRIWIHHRFAIALDGEFS